MDNNPLKQYFRRPAIYIKLPSMGKYYGPGVVDVPENGELPVYPMTAIDEITSRTPDAVFSGQAVVDIIQSCVPNIKNAWMINTIDLDSLIVAIRMASTSEEMDVISTCPACNEESKYGINLINVLRDQTNIDYTQSLKLRELEVKFKPLTYKHTNDNNMSQYELQKVMAMIDQFEDNDEKSNTVKKAITDLNNLMTEMVAATIESIKTPEAVVTDNAFIREFLNMCDRQTNNAIKEQSLKLKVQNQLKPLKMKCISCQHEYQQQLILNITDFFD